MDKIKVEELTTEKLRTIDVQIIHEIVHELYEDEKYKEVIDLMDKALSAREESYFYRVRALSRTHLNKSGLEGYVPALQDIDKALELDLNEKNLYIKLWIYEKICNEESPGSSEVLPYFNYEKEEIELETINVEFYDTFIIDNYEINLSSKFQILDQLIEMNPDPEYYFMRAQFSRDWMYKGPDDWKTRNLKAYDDIKRAVVSKQDDKVFKLKLEIELELDLWKEALLTSDIAYEKTKKIDFLFKKADLLIKRKKINEALVVLNTIEAIKPPEYLDSDYVDCSEYVVCSESGNFSSRKVYAKKLSIFLDNKEFREYARYLVKLYEKKIPMHLSKWLRNLTDADQYSIILEFFPANQSSSMIIRWFNICSYASINELKKARELLNDFSLDKLFEEELEPLPICKDEGLFIQKIEDREYNAVSRSISAMPFDKISELFFVELLEHIFNVGCFPSILAGDYFYIKQRAIQGSDFIKRYVGKRFTTEEVAILNENPDNEAAYRFILLKSINGPNQPPQSFRLVKEIIMNELSRKLVEIKALSIEKAKTDERNRIMANLSHSIKNMLRSVIDPLLLIKKEIPEKAKVIDDALKGANLIREIVNAINLSYKTTLEDLAYDIAHHGKDSVSLEEMIVNSLKYSIGNMFDDKYFPQYMEKYFPKKDAYRNANADWNKISGTNSISDITVFANQYMFSLKIDGSEVANYMIGNEKSSAIKLMILFQEIIFNAVKYSCYVPKTKRHIEISLTEHENKLSFKVVNSYNSKVQPKSTGVGKLIIENFAKVLGCEPVITTENEVYSITMEFKDYWREK